MINDFNNNNDFNITDIIHDFKTPITSIIGFVELLKKGDHDEETQNEFYDIIDSEAQRLLSMINNILYISKTRKNRRENQCNIVIQINKYVKEMKPLAEKRNIQIDLNLPSADVFVPIPEEKAARILLNIIENAIKYNKDSGKVFVGISQEKESVIITIKDTGMGIAPEDIDKIFNKYYRSPVCKKLNIAGSGLGLAIAQDIINSYNGSIKVKSELNKETEFIISLPLKNVSD